MEFDKNEPKFSVIIVSYNCLSYLKKCINSIWINNDIKDELEVIVVDNSIEDDTINWLKEQENVKYIRNVNKGFGEANNVGASIAKGKYLLFLNPDTILIEPIFKYAIEKFENNSSVGMFGYQLVDIKGKKTSTYGLRMSMGLLRTIFCKLLICFNIFIPKIMYTSGADIFIRKNVFYEAGKFDVNIFMYCEEADLSNRVNSCGYKNAFYKEKKIVHLEGKTQNNNLYKTYVRQLESREYYCKKYNMNFLFFLRLEKRYCSMKKNFMKLTGNKLRANEYEMIINYIKKRFMI